ncbi:MAG: cobalamin biosynthesis protein CobQ [Pseudomonadota bacterium]
MNTPAHLILGAAAFGKPNQNHVIAAAVIGSLLPDLSLYLLAGWELVVRGTNPQIVFGQLYFSDAWQQVFAIDNSFVLWGIALGLAVWRRIDWAVALTAGALLHIALDFPLHNEDARMHFWPLTEWRFYSPWSYWDSASGGRVIGVMELVLVMGAAAFAIMRFRAWGWRALIAALAALQGYTFYQWYFFF